MAGRARGSTGPTQVSQPVQTLVESALQSSAAPPGFFEEGPGFVFPLDESMRHIQSCENHDRQPGRAQARSAVAMLDFAHFADQELRRPIRLLDSGVGFEGVGPSEQIYRDPIFHTGTSPECLPRPGVQERWTPSSLANT